MRSQKAGDLPECEPVSESQRRLAENTVRTVEFVLGRVDHGLAAAHAIRERAAAFEKTLDVLTFDVRACGKRLRNTVANVVDQSHRRPGHAAALCRHAANTLQQSVDLATFADDDPALEQHEAESRAQCIRLRDELLASFEQEGVTLEEIATAITALRAAAAQIEGC
jgi:hypothetical protein